jgi:hypothetical protein
VRRASRAELPIFQLVGVRPKPLLLLSLLIGGVIINALLLAEATLTIFGLLMCVTRGWLPCLRARDVGSNSSCPIGPSFEPLLLFDVVLSIGDCAVLLLKRN